MGASVAGASGGQVMPGLGLTAGAEGAPGTWRHGQSQERAAFWNALRGRRTGWPSQERAAFWNALRGRRTGWPSAGAHLHPHELGPDCLSSFARAALCPNFTQRRKLPSPCL